LLAALAALAAFHVFVFVAVLHPVALAAARLVPVLLLVTSATFRILTALVLATLLLLARVLFLIRILSIHTFSSRDAALYP
jgi:hypothetical protein